MAEPRAFSNFKRIIAGSASTEKDIEAMKDEIADILIDNETDSNLLHMIRGHLNTMNADISKMISPDFDKDVFEVYENLKVLALIEIVGNSLRDNLGTQLANIGNPRMAEFFEKTHEIPRFSDLEAKFSDKSIRLPVTQETLELDPDQLSDHGVMRMDWLFMDARKMAEYENPPQDFQEFKESRPQELWTALNPKYFGTSKELFEVAKQAKALTKKREAGDNTGAPAKKRKKLPGGTGGQQEEQTEATALSTFMEDVIDMRYTFVKAKTAIEYLKGLIVSFNDKASEGLDQMGYTEISQALDDVTEEKEDMSRHIQESYTRMGFWLRQAMGEGTTIKSYSKQLIEKQGRLNALGRELRELRS